MAVSLGTTYVDIIARIDGFEKNILKATQKLDKFGKAAQRMGKTLTTRLTAPVLGMGAVTIKTFANFEQQMLKVKAISGATGSEFDKLEADAKRLGSTTRFTASQVAGLQLVLSKKGFKPDQIIDSTESILALAQATDEDLVDSADVAAGTLRAFGMEANQMGRITDVMAKSFGSSALTLEKFKVAMSSSGATAFTYGVSIEETAAILGILVDRNVEASTAGTAFRNILLDVSKEGLDLNQVLTDIRESTDPLTTAFDFFGKRGANVSTILSQNTDAISALADVLDLAGGSAKMMQAIMDSGLTGGFFKLKSAVEGAMIALKDNFGPQIKAITTKITAWVNKFRELDESTQTTTVIIALIVAAIGPIILAIGLMAAAVSVAITGFVAIGAAISFLGPVLGVVLTAMGILLLVWDAAWALGEKLGDVLVWMIHLWDDMTDALADVTRGLRNGLVSAFRYVWSFIRTSMISTIDRLFSKLRSLWAFFQKVASAVGNLNPLKSTGEWIGSKISGKALGGPVMGNTPYIVGEVGPELFVPNSSGTIIPNNKMGVGSNITMNFAAGTDMETVSALKNMKQMIAKVAIEAVTEHNLRTA
jgi:hypothetical protein